MSAGRVSDNWAVGTRAKAQRGEQRWEIVASNNALLPRQALSCGL
jgi:hypothetical protein